MSTMVGVVLLSTNVDPRLWYRGKETHIVECMTPWKWRDGIRSVGIDGMLNRRGKIQPGQTPKLDSGEVNGRNPSLPVSPSG